MVQASDAVELVSVELDDGRANVLTPALVADLQATIDGLGSESGLVISGRAGMFSGGLDTATLAGPDGPALLGAMGRLLVSLLSSPRPIAVAADGHAVAAGAMLMLCADVSYVSDRTASFGFPEVANGLALPSGVVDLVRSRVRPDAVLRLAAHGELIGPQDAVAVGLARRVVPSDEVRCIAEADCRRLAALPAAAYAETKELVNRPLIELLSTPR